jgi:hypothetical protein
MTVRQVFYQAVSRGLIDKTEAQYKQTVCRLLADMRRSGDLPFRWIADSTRWMRKPDTHGGLANMLEKSQRTYRRAIWDDQDVYVEIWLEKEALAGVLYDITAKWDVPLMVTRGYPSMSYLYEAAKSIEAENKPAYLYYFGDHDPSGVDISRFVSQALCEYAPDADITFARVAVTPQQIVGYHLPTRPTKTSDTRSKSFQGGSVEVDAISPDDLRWLAENCITKHIDFDMLQRLREVEAAERDTLASIINTLDAA